MVGVCDAANAGRDAGELLAVGGTTPVIDSFADLHVDSVFLGIAAPGGRLPLSWRKFILGAIERG